MAATTDDHPTLTAALAYAARGWRVIPIPPGTKHPAIPAWQTAGTTDTGRIRHWWTQAPTHGIGIVTGTDSRLFVLDIDVAGDKQGDESLHELEQAYGPLPPTYEVITGTGGRHLYYRWPSSGHVIRNSASGALGPGIDVRGEGGQVLAPPTIHPNGRPYAHEASSPPDPADPPGWLVALLTPTPATPTPQPQIAPQSDRPGDLWAAQTAWADLLGADGWTLHHTDPDGEQHWTRPGKDPREGTSATVNYRGSGRLKVFTSSAVGLEADGSYSKLGYLAATQYDGDHTAAAQALAGLGWRPPDTDLHTLAGLTATTAATDAPDDSQEAGPADITDLTDWQPVNLTPILNGDITAPEPEIFNAPGHPPLLYTGRVNSFFGESGGGKTWVTLAAAAQVIRNGHTAMLIDLEDSAHGAVARLRGIGLTDHQLTQQFLYLNPVTPWRPDAATIIEGLITERDVRLVIIDSTGEAMAMGAVKGNDDDDVARWFRWFPRRLADLGPAVVLTDHVPKDPNAPGTYAIGSQRKRAAINGASYRVDAIKAPSRTTDGLLRLVVAKDRHGARSTGTTAIEIIIAPRVHGGTDVTVTPPTSGDQAAGEPFRPTVLMERISDHLREVEQATGREIRQSVRGKNAAIDTAIARLVEEGYVEMATRAGRGGGASFSLIRAYSALHEMTRDEVRPTSPQPRPGAVPAEAEVRPHPFGGRTSAEGRTTEPENGSSPGRTSKPEPTRSIFDDPEN
ncbi:MAG TPA: bifunctional DNA primase/polymerase [Nocardioidaceae bacterium]|nr:bifunctional DNA primase/polymerase [Nocardioidaceae bacterium]